MQLPDPEDVKAVYGFWLQTVFIVEQEDVGVPFLVGKEVRVEGPIKMNPADTGHYAITPAKVHYKDGRFKKLFETIKPAVQDYDHRTGAILCSGNIIAVPKDLPCDKLA